MCKYTVKKLSFERTFIPDWFKTQQMRDKAAIENGGMLELIPYRSYFRIRPKKCVIRLPTFMHVFYNLFLNVIRLKNV